MENKYFNQALGNFTHAAASGGAICHLADLGYTVKEIQAAIDFPTPIDRIRETVWKHYLEKGIICTEDPALAGALEEVSYVQDRDSFGRISFRRVSVKKARPQGDYIRLDLGRQRYKDPAAYGRMLQKLSAKDREYVEGLPWPLTPVWHVADERMKRITGILSQSQGKEADGASC